MPGANTNIGRKKKEPNPFCEAKTRKQVETPWWGQSRIGCSRRGVMQIDGYWVCKLHSDERKRYGWN
jgi:hypothetical protein